MQETQVWVGKFSWRRKWQPTPALLPEKSHGQRSQAGCIPWGDQRVGYDLLTKQQEAPISTNGKRALRRKDLKPKRKVQPAWKRWSGSCFFFKKHTKANKWAPSCTSSEQWLKPQTQQRQVWWIFRRLGQGLLWSIPQNRASLRWKIGMFPVLWWGLHLLKSGKRKKSLTDLSDDGIIKTSCLSSFHSFLIV